LLDSSLLVELGPSQQGSQNELANSKQHPEQSRSSEQTRGGVKTKLMKVTYICRSPKTKVVTCFILLLLLFLFHRFFIAFLGVS
jgi:hypothetical protein